MFKYAENEEKLEITWNAVIAVNSDEKQPNIDLEKTFYKQIANRNNNAI